MGRIDGRGHARFGQARGLRAEGGGGTRRDRPRHGALGGDGDVRSYGNRSLFKDGVGVGAADPERRDPGPADPAGLGPGTGLGEQPQLRGEVREGGADVEGGREHAVPQGHHRLDEPGHSGRRLGVADVRLQRTDEQRMLPPEPVGGGERAGLGAVAERGAGAVGLDGVDVDGGQPGGGEGLGDDGGLGLGVRRGESVTGAVGVDRGAAHEGEHAMAVAQGVGEAFQDDDADTLRPDGAVGVGGERFAAAIGGQHAQGAERDEVRRGGHHGHPTGQRQGALAVAERLGGQVQRDERPGGGGVDGEGGTAQPERVGDAPGQHAGRGAGEQVALDALRRLGQARAVFARLAPDEDPGPAPPQGQRVETRPFDGLPGDLQEHPLLRVHRLGLARADAEEARVEARDVVEEAAPVVAQGR
ncbi:hypothetical protein HerbRD11066_18550 [Herbidospora sp. RD11066]